MYYTDIISYRFNLFSLVSVNLDFIFLRKRESPAWWLSGQNNGFWYKKGAGSKPERATGVKHMADECRTMCAVAKDKDSAFSFFQETSGGGRDPPNLSFPAHPKLECKRHQSGTSLKSSYPLLSCPGLNVNTSPPSLFNIHSSSPPLRHSPKANLKPKLIVLKTDAPLC